jgi:hypothetical protein
MTHDYSEQEPPMNPDEHEYLCSSVSICRSSARSIDPVVAHRKRRNALQALDLYCRFLEQQGLEQLQGGLSPIAAALQADRPPSPGP